MKPLTDAETETAIADAIAQWRRQTGSIMSAEEVITFRGAFSMGVLFGLERSETALRELMLRVGEIER